jgi:two-component system chemotaxis sensor kinase CheA
MSFVNDDLIQGFIDDSREHLANIEAQLMEIEESGEGFDLELVNAVFRAAHSIKGGAGMLGLENIKELGHKLENVLHMVRTRELFPSRDTVSVLLSGFDKLSVLLDHVADPDPPGIESEVAALKALTQAGLPAEEVIELEAVREVPTSGQACFRVDELTLSQVEKDKETLYVVEFDLIHDIHRRKKTPLHVIKILSDVGRIIDSRLDVAAVGTLDGDYSNRLPLYVLFSSPAFSGALSSLLGVEDERIVEVDLAQARASGQTSAPAASAPAPGADLPGLEAAPAHPASGGLREFGDISLRLEDTRAVITLAPSMRRATLPGFKAALLAGMSARDTVVLDWSLLEEADVGFLEMFFSAWRTFVAEGKKLRALAELPDSIQAMADTFGFTGNLLQKQV